MRFSVRIPEWFRRTDCHVGAIVPPRNDRNGYLLTAQGFVIAGQRGDSHFFAPMTNTRTYAISASVSSRATAEANWAG